MFKKLIFSVSVIALGMAGVVIPQVLAASSTTFVQLSEITHAEKIMVCCEMAEQRVIDLDTALLMLRDGRLTITKIDSGVYRVVYPGGIAIVILESGNF